MSRFHRLAGQSLLALAVILSAPACSPPAPPPPAANPAPGAGPAAPGSELAALADAYVAAWNAHDAAQAASFFADDVTYFDASVGTPQKGREAARKNVIEAFLTAIPDCIWSRDSSPIVGPDGVAFPWTFRGTNTGPWADGSAATGKKVLFRGATLLRFVDGRIVFQGDYYDAYGLMTQLGLVK